MDWTGIIVALVAFGGTVVGSMAGIKKSNEVVNVRLEALEKKVDLHNSAMTRIATLETGMEGICKQAEVEIRNLHYRLNDIKKEG